MLNFVEAIGTDWKAGDVQKWVATNSTVAREEGGEQTLHRHLNKG
jgi:hypothetical protein